MLSHLPPSRVGHGTLCMTTPTAETTLLFFIPQRNRLVRTGAICPIIYKFSRCDLEGRSPENGAAMERIYDILERILQLWKKLELVKPGTREYLALMNQIRVLSEEYSALIEVPKKPRESK